MRRIARVGFVAVCAMVVLAGPAAASERFAGRIVGEGADCVAVELEIVIDGGRVTGGGKLAVKSATPVTVAGTRSGGAVSFTIEHRAQVGDDRLQRIPMRGKLLDASRLDVWQEGLSQTCRSARRGILQRQ